MKGVGGFSVESDVELDITKGMEFNDEFNNQLALDKLKVTWNSFSLPHKEEDIIGEWYGAIYEARQKKMLYVVKILQRFLID